MFITQKQFYEEVQSMCVSTSNSGMAKKSF